MSALGLEKLRYVSHLICGKKNVGWMTDVLYLPNSKQFAYRACSSIERKCDLIFWS